MLLAGDIGGTKARLALFENNTCKAEEKYINRNYPNLLSLIGQFLAQYPDKKITSVCLGVAGPVINGRAEETNIPWIVDREELKKVLKIDKVWIINDLDANAWGLQALKEEELICLNPGEINQGNRALISAGTGLGEAGLYWDGSMHHPFACEGGHVDFAPSDEEQIELWRYLHCQFNHVSYERILCGSGIYQLYCFLASTGREKQDSDIEKLSLADEPQKTITSKALKKESAICMRTIDLFLSIYGAAAGNLALKFMSVGGLFVGGGIAPLLIPFFKEGVFLRSFRNKGRFTAFLDKIPVYIVLNDKAALLGAALYAQNFSEKKSKNNLLP